MFTGIILDVGSIEEVKNEHDQMQLCFSTKLKMDKWSCGDSIAVDGCCLTITGFPRRGCWQAVLSTETLALTHFSSAQQGQKVNMEPALHVGDPLGGHMVSGHIDGMAQVTSITEIGEHRRYDFVLPVALAPLVVHKGSVAINGVSLTLNHVGNHDISVNLIPHTLAHTNLGLLHEGDHVNIETDILGRYIQRMMQLDTSNQESTT